MYCTSKHHCDFRNGWVCKMRQSCNIPCCSAYFYESNCAFQSLKALDFQVRSRYQDRLPAMFACNCGCSNYDCTNSTPAMIGMHVQHRHPQLRNAASRMHWCASWALDKCRFMTIHKEIWIFEQERLDPSSKLYTKRHFSSMTMVDYKWQVYV